MALDFSQLKQQRNSSLNSLIEESKKLEQGGGSNNDSDRFWKPTVDKAGNGYAVIRFLPAAKGDDLPWVRTYNHGFKGPTGKWYIEESLTTIGKDDPVSKFNSELWNSGIEANKEIVRKQKRRLTYTSNIYIVDDPSNPENNGKVFLYKYGKKIWDKINDVMNPQYPDEAPINPFDFWEGADFKLKIRNVEGYRNYDKSEFASCSPLSSDDSELEAIWNQQQPLAEFIDPKNFKSYEELEKKLNDVLGLTSTDAKPSAPAEDYQPNFKQEERSEPKSAPAVSPSAAVEDDEDDAMSFFEKLAEED